MFFLISQKRHYQFIYLQIKQVIHVEVEVNFKMARIHWDSDCPSFSNEKYK